ncbi:NrpR regulatory domain-containing protein [Chloroflexota bacterium]
MPFRRRDRQTTPPDSNGVTERRRSQKTGEIKAVAGLTTIPGGLLEISNSKLRRFVAIIDYHGTSLDPSEQFIRGKMTSVSEAARTEYGKVLGVFRTIPAPAREIVEEKIALLKEAGIGGVYALGDTSESICHIPVALNRFGVVQLGGLNPVAAAVEVGIEIENIAESGLIDFQQLQPVWQL